MANGDQSPGGEGGGQRNTYSEEDVMALMNEAARRAASETMKNTQAQRRDEDEDETSVSVINPKVVKQLKDTVAVFTALKELSSNPLQKTIEETVGGMAASVVQSAFAPRGPPPRQDIVEKLLNSQFAYGLGSGLGQRAPELVETMGRTFGTDKAGQMMDNIIGKYGSGGGGGGGGSRQLSSNPPSSGPSSGPSSSPSSGYSSPSSGQSIPEQKSEKQSEKELLLSLDPNNPEHVSAYAETQGGLPVDVARKMLMIHQDAFIEQLKRDGMNVDQISTQRGSHAQSGPSIQPSPVQQAPIQQAKPTPPSSMRQDVHPTFNDSDDHIEPSHQPIHQSSRQSPDDIEYAEYNDQPNQSESQSNLQSGNPSSPPNVDGQQVEMMKTFATDIGKVMGEMLNKIETLNNTVFTLQNEMNDIKKQGTESSPVHKDISPRSAHTTEFPNMTEAPPISPIKHIDAPILDTFGDTFDTFEDTFEDQIIATPKSPKLDIKRSEDFFEENVIDISNFQQELEQEAKLPVANSNIQRTEQQTPIQEPVKPVPPAPVAQIVPPPTPIIPIVRSVVEPARQQGQQLEKVEKQVEQPVRQQVEQPVRQQVEQPVQVEQLPKEDNIVDIVKPDESMYKVPIKETKIPKVDNKISKDNDDNEIVAPIKETSVHKKAAYRNIKPSFKKNEGDKNKEE